jgi:cytochrome c biogenesis protein CcdA/thiol-disulfide isomerase/thioredoxin
VLLLLFFALLAGAGTALSPCVLPVLPAMLSASGTGGRRRPVGVALGLSVTFTVTIVGVASVVGGVGLGSDPLRYVAIAVLLGFGLALLVPRVAALLERPLARFSRLGPRSRGDGFRSGLLVGGALGFVYTPCAGPILAAVITVGAASGRSVAVAIAFAAGTGLTLALLGLGGRRVFDRIRRAGGGATLQRALGVVMILTAVVLAANLDVKLDEQIAQHIPDVSLTAALERSHAVQSRLTSLHGPARFAQVAQVGPQLKDAGPAPEFTGTEKWFNSAPLTMAGLHGHVVLIDFWTYTCINCIRTLPYLEAWDRRYRADGLTIVGVEAPEFAFEKDAGNVAAAIQQFGIHYPVVQDNNLDTWNAWGNQYWPADYLVDAAGHVRYAAFGEGDYSTTEGAIRELLMDAGHAPGTSMATPSGVVTPTSQTTPETYLGTARAQGWAQGPFPGRYDYGNTAGQPLQLNEFAYGGTWTVGAQQALAGARATIDAAVQGQNVYIVLSPPPGGGTGSVGVLVDGHPPTSSQAGADVHGGTITVTGQRLYNVLSLPSAEQHQLTLVFSPGTSGFSFTFG